MLRAEYLLAYQVIERFSEVCTSVSGVLRKGVDPDKGQALLEKSASIFSASRTELARAGAWTRDIDQELGRAAAAFADGDWEEMNRALRSSRDMWKADRSALLTQIAFFPYQASMWDSLESVWRAAARDSSCEVFVVPVPYVKRGPNGEVLEECYEGERFPKDVPVHAWQEFTGENSLIDIAYIHNPYDDSNYVTQVHPEFFSSALSERVGLLVYIPYYVLADSTMARDTLYSAPGVFNSDLVVVQSQVAADTARSFVECAYREAGFDGDMSALRQLLSQRIQALGSPKFDAIHDAMRRRSEYLANLPEKWAGQVVRRDGTTRPIVLYNTSVGSILVNSEKILDKIRVVLKSFTESNEAVLWWRPHPLSSATLRSMRPELAEEYDRLVEDYRRRGVGIYDDTPDLSPALVLADAYYGDESSLVALFESTGRPTLIQAVRPLGAAQPALSILAAQVHGDYVWCAARGFNALLRISRQSGEVTKVGTFPGEPEAGADLYGAACAAGEHIVFAPMFGRRVAAYQPEAESWVLLDVPRPSHSVVHGLGLFIEALQWEGKAVLIGAGYPGVVVVDPVSGQTEVLDQWVNDVEKLVHDGMEPYARFGSVDGDYVSFACTRAPVFVRVHLRTGEYVVQHIPECSTGFAASSERDGVAWLVERHRMAVVRLDVVTRDYQVFDQFPEGAATESYGSWDIQAFADGALVFPNGAASVYYVAPDGQVRVEESFAEDCAPETPLRVGAGEKFHHVGRYGQNVVAFAGLSGRWLEFAPDGTLSRVPIQLSESDRERVCVANRRVRAWYESSEISEVPLVFHETSTDDLHDLLTLEVRGRDTERAAALRKARRDRVRLLNSRMDGSAGRTIHRVALLKLTDRRRGV